MWCYCFQKLMQVFYFLFSTNVCCNTLMTSTFLQVYPTQTRYTFEQDGVQLNLTVSFTGDMCNHVCPNILGKCLGSKFLSLSLTHTHTHTHTHTYTHTHTVLDSCLCSTRPTAIPPSNLHHVRCCLNRRKKPQSAAILRQHCRGVPLVHTHALQ